MNDWGRIREALFADSARSRGTLEQAWRWTADARAWLDRHGIDVRAATKGDIERYLAQAPEGGVTDRNKRVWAFKRLIAAAKTVGPRRARSPGSAAARLDSVPERSPLGKAIAAVLADPRSEGDRRRWPTCIGTFLLWCDARGLAPSDVWPGDIDAFRGDYLASGRRSPGEYVRLARMLLARLREVREPHDMGTVSATIVPGNVYSQATFSGESPPPVFAGYAKRPRAVSREP